MSTLKVNTLQTAAGVEVYTCKAWVNFNGTGTVAIRASGNVSSITDNGTGDYTVNFTTAMPDVNYGWAASAGQNNVAQNLFVSAPNSVAYATWKQTGLLRLKAVFSNTLADTDPIDFSVAIFR
jgi:hypothetical protein